MVFLSPAPAKQSTLTRNKGRKYQFTCQESKIVNTYLWNIFGGGLMDSLDKERFEKAVCGFDDTNKL